MDHAAQDLLYVALLALVRRMKADGVMPHLSEPQTVAQYFCAAFHIPHPMTIHDVGKLLQKLAYPEVYLRPDLYIQKGVKGEWSKYKHAIRVYVDSSLRDFEIVKALLHEFGELVVAIGYEVHGITQEHELTDKQRERWAQAFVACVKMPPPLFREEAFACGFDHRHLAKFFADSLAGTSRQSRDFCLSDKVLYAGRYDIETAPNVNCKPLMRTIEASHGVPVRIADVVKTKMVDTRRRRRGGALPLYNLPGWDQWRVMHEALHNCVRTGRPCSSHHYKAAQPSKADGETCFTRMIWRSSSGHTATPE